MLEHINLSLSSSCTANCIYCPSNRGKRISKKKMTFSTIKKIVNEINSREFIKNHNIRHIELGENGDAFLNKDIINIMRYIRNNCPYITIGVFTNFINLTKNLADVIINEHLIDSLSANIDGSDPERYFAVKGLDYKNITQNMNDFIFFRNKAKSDVPIRLLILTLDQYITTIYNNFGFYPSKVKDNNSLILKDECKIIKKQWYEKIDINKDKLSLLSPIGWAERNMFKSLKINYKFYSCPKLDSINHEAFIAPDGTWYACCLDSNNELELGNIEKSSLHEIYISEKRANFIKMLKKKQFDKIGGPCKTVNCCQPLQRMKILSNIRQMIMSYDSLNLIIRHLSNKFLRQQETAHRAK